MPSRKRNKGKERKAKKDAERVDIERAAVRKGWQGIARGLESSGGLITPCNHCVLTIPDDKNHPASCFIDTFFINLLIRANTFSNMKELMVDTFQKHREVWDNTSYRKMAVDIMIGIGKNYMFGKEFFCGPDELGNSCDIARVIVVLENYDGSEDLGSTIGSRRVSTKWRDLGYVGFSAKRDLLKFYRKRIHCSCLKKFHLEARKALPKTGICLHCKIEKERSLLMVCSRCRVDQYCSRECQIADWPKHKCDCDLYVKAQQKYTMNSGSYEEDKTS